MQGVGFRHFIRSKANKLGLTGWARNLPDGSVEAVVQGSKTAIEEIIKHCKKGPFISNIENVEIQWEKPLKKFEDFVIL